MCPLRGRSPDRWRWKYPASRLRVETCSSTPANSIDVEIHGERVRLVQRGAESVIEVTIRLRRIPRHGEVVIDRIPVEEIRVAERLPAVLERVGREVFAKRGGAHVRTNQQCSQTSTNTQHGTRNTEFFHTLIFQMPHMNFCGAINDWRPEREEASFVLRLVLLRARTRLIEKRGRGRGRERTEKQKSLHPGKLENEGTQRFPSRTRGMDWPHPSLDGEVGQTSPKSKVQCSKWNQLWTLGFGLWTHPAGRAHSNRYPDFGHLPRSRLPGRMATSGCGSL